MTDRLQVGVLISGRGSNMLALARAADAPDYPCDICVVISNTPDAAGLALAREAGLAAVCVDQLAFQRDRAAHERAVDDVLRAHGAEAVCLAGYMRLLSPFLVERWQGRMLNIHPSLLPDFPGLDTHARALAAGVAEHGCSVHLVSEGVDEGPVLAQSRVPVLPGDDAAALAARVLVEEHRLYPAALADFAVRLRSKQSSLL